MPILTNPSKCKNTCEYKSWLTRIAASLVLAPSLLIPITSSAAVIAHWTFDEVSGTVANDSVGSFNGTLSTSGSAFVSGGISGNAIDLSRANNGYVTMGDVLGLTSGDFSLVAWVKTSIGDTTSDSVIINKHRAFSDNGYLLGLNLLGGGGQVDKAIFYDGNTVGAPISTTSVNDGNWHQIVATYQSVGNASIYVDGAPVEDFKVSLPISSTVASFVIGGDVVGSTPRGLFTGLIDEVQIYNNALSDSEITTLFQNPMLAVPEPKSMGLIAVSVFVFAALRRRIANGVVTRQ